jgi:RND family efflux transporter MFP subunit
MRSLAATALAVLPALTVGSSLAQDIGADGELPCLIQPHVVVKLGSSVEGVLAEVAVDRGDFVKQGDVVARLESEVEEASVALAEARAKNDVRVQSSGARFAYEQRKQQRARKLSTRNVVSESALDEAEINAELAQFNLSEARFEMRIAGLELKRAREILARRTIKSPVDGVVVERSLSPGEYAYEQAQLMTIAEIDPLNVEVYVPIAMYGRVEPGARVEVRPDPPIGGAYQAEVSIVDRVFDAASGTFGVRLLLANPDYRLPAGLRCSVRFEDR